MRTFLIVICLSFLSTFCNADPIYKSSGIRFGLANLYYQNAKKTTEYNKISTMTFGYVMFDSQRLNNYFNANFTTVRGQYDPFYYTVAFGAIGNIGHSDGFSMLSMIIPQSIYVGANDSLQYRFGGWHWCFNGFGFDAIEHDAVDLALGIAWSVGNLKVKEDPGGNVRKWKNPFVAPGFRAELRFKLGDFVIGARAIYRYDITHSLWKRKSDNMPVLPTYKNTGLSYFGYIGLMLGN